MAGIYISWPFCAQKCTYCNFASGVQPKELEAHYASTLIAQMDAHQWAWTPETLYIGGGTPSAIEPELFERLLKTLPGRPWREATIEAAPGSLTAGKVEAWKNVGINRVSLGVQSFVKRELARTGRRHDASTVERDLALLRAHGIGNINIDLIAGLPGHTESTWRESLEAAIASGAPHISVYMLEVDEDSRLGSEIILGGARYGAQDVPSDDLIASFYEQAAEQLAAAGILRYEISNFAKPGFESIHNLKYWRREPYIGFGADAHSFDGIARWRNAETASEYLQSPDPIDRAEAKPEEEKFFVGLRLSDGIAANEEDWLHFGPVFERFLSAGIMETHDGRLRLTPRGIMVSNEVFQEFIAA